MKRKIFLVILLFCLVSGTILSTTAVTQLNEKERGYISVSTSANTDVAPDVAEITFAVKTSDTKSIQKATAENKEISDRLYGLLKNMLNANNGDYVNTTNFHASPIYVYSGNKKNLDKYEVTNSVIVHTKSLDKVGTMIDKAIESGATNVNSLKFSVSNYESQCNNLIETASKKAASRAAIAVRGTNSSLDGIRTMDVSCSENTSYSTPRMYMAKNMLSSVAADSEAGGEATSISGGAIKIYANINTSFYVK